MPTTTYITVLWGILSGAGAYIVAQSSSTVIEVLKITNRHHRPTHHRPNLLLPTGHLHQNAMNPPLTG